MQRFRMATNCGLRFVPLSYRACTLRMKLHFGLRAYRLSAMRFVAGALTEASLMARLAWRFRTSS